MLPDEPEEDAPQMTYVLDNHGVEDVRVTPHRIFRLSAALEFKLEYQD